MTQAGFSSAARALLRSAARLTVALPLAYAFLALWLLAVSGGLGVEIPVQPQRVTPESGLAWFTTLPGALLRPADDAVATVYGPSRLTEDLRSLGPGRSLHADIRSPGQGRFALDGPHLRFSTSDGSDPRSNGKVYRLVSAAIPGPALHALAGAAVAIVLWSMWTKGRTGPRRRAWRAAAAACVWAVAVLLLWGLTTGSLVLPTPRGLVMLAVAVVAPFVPWRRSARALARTAKPLGEQVERLRCGLGALPLHPCRIALGGMAAALVLWFVTLTAVAPMNLNYNDSLTATLWHAGEIFPAPGTIQTEVYRHLPTLLPRLLAPLHRLGLDAITLHKALALLFSVLGMGAVGVVAVGLAGARGAVAGLAGALALAVLVQGSAGSLYVGYGLFLHVPNLLLGSWGAAALVAAWCYWLLAMQSTRATIVGAGLAGLVFDLHSTYGLFMLGIILTEIALRGVTAWRPVEAIRSGALASAAFGVVAAPQFYLLASMITAAAPPPSGDEAEWWMLMTLRKPSHIDLWQGPISIVPALLWLAAMWGAALIALGPLVTTDRLRRLAATLLAVAVFCGIAAAAVLVRPTPALVGPVLTRSALLVLAAMPALLAALVALSALDWARSGGTVRLLRLALAAAATMLWSLQSFEAALIGPALMSLVGAGLAGRLRDRRLPLVHGSAKDAAAPLLIAMTAIAVAVPFLLVPVRWRDTLAQVPAGNSEEWKTLTAYVRKQIPRDELVLMPPYPYAIVSTRHANPADYGYMGYSVYARWLVPFELEQIRTLFGFDLGRSTPRTVAQATADQGGLLCIVERGYDALSSDRDRVLNLRSRYPTMRYVVAVKPSAVGDEAVCGPASTARLDLDVVFESERYIVYKLPE